jgi:hypothetical protein
MTILSTLLALAPVLAGTSANSGGLVAIKVGRAETAAKGVLEHAVILVDQGKIVEIGQDLPVERGIPVIDRPDWVVMPGLVNPYTRLGLESRSGSESSPEVSPTPEISPRHPDYRDVLEAGVTTLGIYPPGMGIPGHTAAIRPHGDSIAEMLLKEETYVKVYFRANAASKKLVKDAWGKVDEYDEKVKKAKEKWDKDNEKSKSKSSEKKEEPKPDAPKDEKKEEEKKDEKKDDKSKAFVPPEADAKVKPFLQVRDGKLGMLVTLSQSADWLHWLDAIGERKFDYSVRVTMTRELDLFEVKEEIGKKGLRVVLEPEITLHPNTMRQRNIPMELSQAGAKVVLIPRNDTVTDHENWLRNVGEMVAAGLDRQVAIKAVTLEAAAALGLDKELGSLEKGKTANMVFYNGDPLEVGTQVQAVMLDGEFVFGEIDR